MVKQTAGRDKLGEFAPKFAEINDDVLSVKCGVGKTNFHFVTVHLLQLLHLCHRDL